MFVVTEEEDELFRMPFTIDNKKEKEKVIVTCKPIVNKKSEDIGICYA